MQTEEKICIFTDSAADIPYEQAEKYGISILPVLLTFGGKTIREYYDITPQEYWKVLKNEQELPTTAQVQLNDFYEFYKKAAADGYNKIIGIIINGGGSGTFSAACTARNMFYDENGTQTEIVLLDSGTYSYLYGSIAIECAKMRDSGMGFREIAVNAQKMLSDVFAVLGIYTLKYLKKSGRISGGAAFVGEALGFRPIALVADGGVNVCGRVRGDRQVIPAMVEKAKKQLDGAKIKKAGILYADVPEEEICRLEQLLKSELSLDGLDRTPIGSAVTTNAGPNSLAVYFIKDE